VPLKGETVAVRQDGKREHFKPVLPTRFKAAIWVSPKGSGRRFHWVQGGVDAEGRGVKVEPTSGGHLDAGKAWSLESPEKHPDPPLQGRERGSGP
jgi:hypothetical protein